GFTCLLITTKLETITLFSKREQSERKKSFMLVCSERSLAAPLGRTPKRNAASLSLPQNKPILFFFLSSLALVSFAALVMTGWVWLALAPVSVYPGFTKI